MSDNAFGGLRPVVKRQLGGDLDRKTRRIVLPTSTEDDALPLPTIDPPRVIPAPKPAVEKPRFSLVAMSPALLGALPNGILLTPGWLFIGSNPSIELPAFTFLVLRLDGVSQVHAAVTEFDNKPFITDLGSTNGTRVFRDQQAIEIGDEPVELIAGDIVWIGPTFFQVVQS